MESINEGIDSINTIQGFMMAKINSMSGILYFLLQIIIIALLTSVKSLRNSRFQSFLIVGVNILAELLLPDFVVLLVGIKWIRILFAMGHLTNFIKNTINR